MRTAIINFGPGGSTGRIGSSLYHALEKRKEYVLFAYGYPNDEENLPPSNSYQIGNRLDHKIHFSLSSLFGLQGFFSIISTFLFLQFVKKKNINTFFLIDIHGCYLNEWLLFKYIKKHAIRTVYIMIDEYAMLGRCCYSFDCNKYIGGCGNCPHLETTPSTKYDFSKWNFALKKNSYANLTHTVFVAPECIISKAKGSSLLKNQHLEILDEAIDIELFAPRSIEETTSSLNLPKDKIIILCVAPMVDERKGCQYYLQVAREMIDHPDFLFVHVGCNPSMEYPDNYLAIPFVKDQSLLADYMSCADLFVFPSLADSMPSACLDALACGTPLLCFDLPGMTCLGDDTVLTLVPPKDIASMKNIIAKTCKKTSDTINKCRTYALKRYDSRKYNSKLIDIATQMYIKYQDVSEIRS